MPICTTIQGDIVLKDVYCPLTMHLGSEVEYELIARVIYSGPRNSGAVGHYTTQIRIGDRAYIYNDLLQDGLLTELGPLHLLEEYNPNVAYGRSPALDHPLIAIFNAAVPRLAVLLATFNQYYPVIEDYCSNPTLVTVTLNVSRPNRPKKPLKIAPAFAGLPFKGIIDAIPSMAAEKGAADLWLGHLNLVPTPELQLLLEAPLEALMARKVLGIPAPIRQQRVLSVGSALLQLLAIQHELGEELNLNVDTLLDMLNDPPIIVRCQDSSIDALKAMFLATKPVDLQQKSNFDGQRFTQQMLEFNTAHILWDESRRPPTSERVEISWVLPNNNDPIYFPLPSVAPPELSRRRSKSVSVGNLAKNYKIQFPTHLFPKEEIGKYSECFLPNFRLSAGKDKVFPREKIRPEISVGKRNMLSFSYGNFRPDLFLWKNLAFFPRIISGKKFPTEIDFDRRRVLTVTPVVLADATAVAPIPELKDKATARGRKRKAAGKSEEPASKRVRKTKELAEGSAAPRRSKSSKIRCKREAWCMRTLHAGGGDAKTKIDGVDGIKIYRLVHKSIQAQVKQVNSLKFKVRWVDKSIRQVNRVTLIPRRLPFARYVPISIEFNSSNGPCSEGVAMTELALSRGMLEPRKRIGAYIRTTPIAPVTRLVLEWPGYKPKTFEPFSLKEDATRYLTRGALGKQISQLFKSFIEQYGAQFVVPAEGERLPLGE
ncbi:hypothetical protein C8R43DRAFT_946165 [Mycena crocata]|nr:hypothetical protein C8R43DRAFT_946165 [Mycena crocata]